MSEEIKVSLLMPIYNVVRYLPEAMESALGQSLKDIEIICIDDGSTDGSGEIIDSFAKTDSRIRVLHKPNEGYGKTMNIALDMARGRYVAILEPDDWLDVHMLEDLYDIAERYQTDFVKSDFCFFEGERNNYQERVAHIYWKNDMYDKILFKDEIRELFRGYLAYCTCLYRRSFIEENKIRFNETQGASYQDTGFWFQTMALAERVYLHNGVYYHYRQDNPDSSTQSKEKVYCITEEYDYIYHQLEERGLLQEYWPQYIAFSFIGHRDALYRIGYQYKYEFIQHIAKFYGRFLSEGRLDRSFMDKQDIDMMEEILDNPRSFYQVLVSIPSYIHDCIASYGGFYIYGAGTRGIKIYNYLSEQDGQNFKGFIVTIADSCNRVNGQQVYSIDEINIDDNIGVIIGVTERYEEEIRNILVKRGIKNIIVFSERKVL